MSSCISKIKSTQLASSSRESSHSLLSNGGRSCYKQELAGKIKSEHTQPFLSLYSSDQLNMHSIWCVVIIFTALFAHCNTQCNSSISCYPTPGNLLLGRTVQVSSECLDQICPDGVNLTACENASAKFINDGNTATYWVSQIQSNLTLPVILQVNLKAAMTFYDMSLLWESSTPYSMVLERSNDFGITWTPYRFWSYNCLGSFGLIPSSVLNAPFQTQDAICTDMQLSDQSGAEVSLEYAVYIMQTSK